MKYAYSLDNEQYIECNSTNNIRRIVNIIMSGSDYKEYIEKNGVFFIYLGEKEEYEPYIYVNDIIEELKKQAYDEVDDENYLDDIEKEELEELEKKLNATLNKFLKKYSLISTRFYVRNVKKYRVSADGKEIIGLGKVED